MSGLVQQIREHAEAHPDDVLSESDLISLIYDVHKSATQGPKTLIFSPEQRRRPRSKKRRIRQKWASQPRNWTPFWQDLVGYRPSR